MNYNFLTEKIRQELSAKFAEKIPVSLMRSNGCPDDGTVEKYLVCYEARNVLFSGKFG